MPDRIIHAKSTSSSTLKALSDAAERAWWRLTVCVDDYGRIDADPEILLNTLFKVRPKGWALARMERSVQEWTVGAEPLVHLYRVPGDSRTYLHICTFSRHQRDRESKPKCPDPPCDDLPQLAATCRESLQLALGSRESGAESREPLIGGCGKPPQPALQQGANSNGIPDWFKQALADSEVFASLAHGESAFWYAMSQAYDPYEWLKWDEEIQKMAAWIAANPQRKPRALKRFIRNWFERAVEHRRRYATPARVAAGQHQGP